VRRFFGRGEGSFAASIVLSIVAGAIVGAVFSGSLSLTFVLSSVAFVAALVILEIRRRRAEKPPRHAALGRTPAEGRYRFRQALIVGLPLALAVGLGTWFYTYRTGLPQARFTVTSTADTDRLTNSPQLTAGLGNYVTSLPAMAVPQPPGQRDSCAGRYQWAHKAPINGIDAERTVFVVHITAKRHTGVISGAEIHYDNPRPPALRSTLLACPGAGGTPPPMRLSLDLDTGERTFDIDGDNKPDSMNVPLPVGETVTLIVDGSTLHSYAKWRLVLGLASGDGGKPTAVTIGLDSVEFGRPSDLPDQRPFETTGALDAKPYRFRNGKWVSGR
jgi:hypothetical protein